MLTQLEENMDIGEEQRTVRVVPEMYPEVHPENVPDEPNPRAVPVEPEPALVPV